MSKLSHQDMRPTKQNKPAAGGSPQTFIVEDATQPSVDDRLAEFEAPAFEDPGPEFILPPKKNVTGLLEKLIFAGRITKEVTIDNIVFEISSLSNKEHGEVLRELYRFAESADLFTIRVLTLANAIRSVDGVSLDDIEIDGDFENNFHKRMSIIDCLQQSIVEKLFDEYNKLTEEEKKVDEKAADDLKNS